MALLPQIEAAIRLGISVELLEYFTTTPPKSDGRILKATSVEGAAFFDDVELLEFQRHLREPWRRPKVGRRPRIPAAIQTDIKQEAHYGCAICGHMDNGEVAHIDPVATSLNNSPENLIFLCPNHHTKYDYGFKASNNLTTEVVLAAKKVKQQSRRRIMRAEANATKVLAAIGALLKDLAAMLKKDGISEDEAKVYVQESRQLLAQIHEVTASAQEAGNNDGEPDEASKLIKKAAPRLSKLIGANIEGPTQVRNAARRAVKIVDDIFGDLDEEDCPHCGGRGTTGLVGHLCAYCEGACFVTKRTVAEYDRGSINEHNCPRCQGNGQTGLVGDLCAYCKGACVLPQYQVDDYSADDVDEVECPHCGGRGLTGLASDFCAYCRGSRVVSKAEAASFHPDDIDEVECPHCGGRGLTGLAGDFCAYCRGSRVVSKAEAARFHPDDIDEVECPHCGGRGLTGLAGDFCAYCRGSRVVSKAEAARFHPDDIDEVECPHCGGTGQRGMAGHFCKVCNGSQVISRDRAEAYAKRTPNR